MQLVAISTALLCLRLVVGHPSDQEWDTKKEPISYSVEEKIREKPVSVPITVEFEKPEVIEKTVYKKVFVDKKVPAPYPVPSPYSVPIPNLKQVPVPRGYPTPVVVPVAKAVPVKIPFPVPIFVKVPVPAPLPVPKKVRVPVPVDTPVKFPVGVPIPVRVPVGVARPVYNGKENYISPGWGALGLKDSLDLKELKGPLQPGSWKAWAKSLPLETLQDWSKSDIYGRGSSWDTKSFEGLGDLESIREKLDLDKFEGLDLDSFRSSIDDVFGKDLNSNLLLDGVRGSSDWKNEISIDESSENSKVLETIVESAEEKVHQESLKKKRLVEKTE